MNYKFTKLPAGLPATFITDVFTIDPTSKYWIRLHKQLSVDPLSRSVNVNVNMKRDLVSHLKHLLATRSNCCPETSAVFSAGDCSLQFHILHLCTSYLPSFLLIISQCGLMVTGSALGCIRDDIEQRDTQV